MKKEIHELLKVKNDETTIFTNKELKMIDDYIKELEAYKYNLDRDYLRLEKENQELKKQLEKTNTTLDTHNELIEYMKNQQKEFIYYMNKTIEELKCDDVDDEELKGYLIQRIDTFKEILSKYKKIIGYVNE